MYLVREVLNCKPGKVGEMVRKFNAVSDVSERLGYGRFRFLTDVSGEPFWTLVAEIEVESVDGFFEAEQRITSESEAQQAMAGYHDLIVSGRREIYRIQG